MKLFFMLVAVMLISGSVQAHPQYHHRANVSLLRDVICKWETRNDRIPDEAVGRDGEVGRCQIMFKTARLIGYRGTALQLMDRQLNEYWSLRYLRRCWRWGYRSPWRLSYCYNAGLRARVSKRSTAFGYADSVYDLYVKEYKKRLWLPPIYIEAKKFKKHGNNFRLALARK